MHRHVRRRFDSASHGMFDLSMLGMSIATMLWIVIGH
jgi:hypothetical protein